MSEDKMIFREVRAVTPREKTFTRDRISINLKTRLISMLDSRLGMKLFPETRGIPPWREDAKFAREFILYVS